MERYGGISRPVKIPLQGAQDVPIYRTYPIRQGISDSECYQQNGYLELVPDERYLNLTYMEVLRPMAEVTGQTYGNFQFRGRVRLVFWLNLPKMGVHIDNIVGYAGIAARDIIAALSGDGPDNAGGRYMYSNFSVLTSDMSVFSRYDYGPDADALMLYPFDFGAVDFDVDYLFSQNCVSPLAVGAPIECVQEWKFSAPT
ncbi:hypothetical protein [Lewinella sp. W8]|uniref:hypothetical protein n=1 Tax=Lewinella sp. W8 TaxID=2528208 RepID=UPI0010676C7A|nr:hypothetical protein [Lewinella sp. W8]MTB53016.1 hypothetical protein [Lewinella sp. W8]